MKKMFLSMAEELLIVEEESGQWKTKERLQGLKPTSIAVDPVWPNRVYCGTFGRGLWHSEDGGDSWSPLGFTEDYYEPLHKNGIPYSQVTFVAVDSRQRIYVGTEPTAVFISEDGGKTWSECKEIQHLPSKSTWSFPPRPHTSHIRWITPDPNQANRLFVSIEFGAVIRSLDGGKTWQDRKFSGPLDAHTLLMHPQVPNRLYAACGDGLMKTGHGFAQSFDAGETWQYMSDGLRHHYLYGLAVDPADPETILVSAAANPRDAHHRQFSSMIYRKQADEPWEEVNSGLPETEGTIIPILATHPREPHTFYALNNKGLYRSSDTGRTWERIEIPWKEEYLDQHPHSLWIEA